MFPIQHRQLLAHAPQYLLLRERFGGRAGEPEDYRHRREDGSAEDRSHGQEGTFSAPLPTVHHQRMVVRPRDVVHEGGQQLWTILERFQVALDLALLVDEFLS